MVTTLKQARELKKSPEWQKMSPYKRMEALYGPDETPRRKMTAKEGEDIRKSFAKSGWKNFAKLFQLISNYEN